MKRLLFILISLSVAYNSFAELSITLNVENAGSLSTMIASSRKNEITSLTLTGNLNGSDIKYIREMAGAGYKGSSTNGQLSFLDISNVNIVKGGDYYAFEHTAAAIGYTDKKYYTSDNTITPFMFDDCYRLKTLLLPNSVTKIEADAFYNTSVASVTLPSSLQAFECTIESFYLKEIKISSSNNFFKVVDGVLFSEDMKKLYRCPVNYPNAIFVIPDGVEIIGRSAFYYCKNIKSFDYPTTLASFGYLSLAWMNLDKFVMFPNVTYSSLGDFTNITEVEIKDGFTSFDASALGRGSDRANIKVTRVKIHCNTPPSIPDIWSTFNPEILKGTLYVPQGTYSNYYIAYGWGDFKNIVEDASLGHEDEATKCEPPIITFSEGKIQYSSNTPNSQYHYSISSPDIKSGITGSDVELDAYYEISVYAIADGYTQSDKATARLYWVDATLKDPSSINSVQNRGLLVKSNNGFVEIVGLSNNEEVSFYSIDGKLIGKSKAIGDAAQISTFEKIVIAKIGNSSIKISTK